MAIFEEYAARFARGERPDLREYLERVGGDRDELARLVDAFLTRVEPPPPGEEDVALMEAWIAGRAPLTELRARRGLKRSEVVEALIERFGLDKGKRRKVERYLHEIETGQLVPAERRLLDALAEILRARVSDILALRPRPLEAKLAYMRAAAPEPTLAAPAAAAQEPPDEIDELFRPAQRR